MTSSNWIEAIFCIAQKFRLVQTAVAWHATGASGGKATGGEAVGIFCGPLIYFTKSKWQTLGDDDLFNLAYILPSCQNTRFAKLILTNSWRCLFAFLSVLRFVSTTFAKKKRFVSTK